MDVPAMYPGEEYAGGVVLEMLGDRRCSVRLNDGRVIVGHIPVFCREYYPEPGHEVTVFLRDYPELKGEFLLVGFPRMFGDPTY
jgi:translation initiation factor IF-1